MMNKIFNKIMEQIIKKFTKKRLALILSGLLLAVLFVVGIVCPFTIDFSGGPPPEDEVQTFFDCLAAGDYSGADCYIYEYTTLGLNNNPVEICGYNVSDLLRESRSVYIKDSVIHGQTAVVHIRLNTLSFLEIEYWIDKIIAENNISDEAAARQKAESVLTMILQEPKLYYKAMSLDLNLIKYRGQWKIVLNKEFYAAITGYAAG